MATIDDLVTELRDYLGESSTTLPTATAVECVNTAVRRMQRLKPWLGQQHTVDLTVPTTGTVPLPADFVNEIGVWLKDTAQTDPAAALTPIRRTSRPAWIEREAPFNTSQDTIYPNVAAPGARHDTDHGYYTWRGLLTIVSSPSAAITITLDYIRLWPDLVASSGGSNVFTDTYRDVARQGALAEASRYAKEFERSAVFEALFQGSLGEAVRFDEAPAMAGGTKSRGK